MTTARVYMNSDISGTSGFRFQVCAQYDEARPESTAYINMYCNINGKARNEAFVQAVNMNEYSIMGYPIPPLNIDRIRANRDWNRRYQRQGGEVPFGFTMTEMSGYHRSYLLGYHLTTMPVEEQYNVYTNVVIPEPMNPELFYQWFNELNGLAIELRRAVDAIGRR